MKNNIFVKNYQSLLDVSDTQLCIKLIKDTFENLLSESLGLVRVTAPLFIEPTTGLNDELTGVETPVSFVPRNNPITLEIVQSLAKWKRYALRKYGFDGIYTDMNAIRPFEDMDNLHSLYVDQWDWEKIITPNERTIDYLKSVVNKIYFDLKETERIVTERFPIIPKELPDEITFITTEELLQKYPNLTPKERENAIVREKKAVFLMKIGHKLSNGEPHDKRASDYDDWNLNGDLLLYHKQLDLAFEISSMGIRVNKDSLIEQLTLSNEVEKLNLAYHQAIIANTLPLTIGGGIGQSRLCMYFLKKVHIGEVQSSYWSEKEVDEFKKFNINLL